MDYGFDKKFEEISNFQGTPVKKLKEEFSDSESILCTAYDVDKLVGVEGFISYDVWVQGSKSLAYRSERTLVDPTYRGKQIFKNLVDTCKAKALSNNATFCFGSTLALKAFAKVGFEPYSGIRDYYYVSLNRNIFLRWFAVITASLFAISNFKSLWSKNLTTVDRFMQKLCLTRRGYSKAVHCNVVEVTYQEYVDIERPESFVYVYPRELSVLGDVRFFVSRTREGYLGFALIRESRKSFRVIDLFKQELVNMSELGASISDVVLSQGGNTFTLRLNNKCYEHRELAKIFNEHSLCLKNIGNIIVLPLRQQEIEIEKMYMTDIWLEL